LRKEAAERLERAIARRNMPKLIDARAINADDNG
jgi:hypothetical protein